MHQTASTQTSVYFITKSSSLKQNQKSSSPEQNQKSSSPKQNQKPSLQEQPPKVFFAEATTKGNGSLKFPPPAPQEII
jgi:phage antirepressor YoqD-like protein